MFNNHQAPRKFPLPNHSGRYNTNFKSSRNDQPLSRSDRFLHLPSLQTQGLEASGTTNGLEGLPAHQTSGLTDCNPLEPYLSDDMVHTVEKGNKITLMKVTPEEESHDYERVKVEDFEWMCFEIHCFEDAQNSEITWYTELHPVYRGYENEDSQDSPLKETHIRIVKVGFKKDPDRSHWIQWQTNALKDVVKTAHLGLKYFTDVYEQDYVFFKAFPCYGKIPRQYFAQLAEASEETKKHQAIEFSNQSGQNRKSPTQYQNPAQSTSQNGIHTLLAKRAFGDIYQQMSPTEHTERPASAQGLHDTPATQTGETASSNALLERPSLEGNKIKVVKVSSKQTWSPSDGFQYILTNELIMSRRFELRYFTDAKDPHWSFYFKEVRPFYTGNVKSKTTFKAWASGLRIQLVKIDTQENPDPKFWKHWPSAALDAVVKHTNLDFEWCEGCRFPDRTAFKCSTHLLADTIAHSQKSLSFESATEEQVVSTQIMKSSRPQSQQPPVAGFSLDGHAFPPLVNNPKPKKSKKLKAANLRDSSSKPFEENSKQKKPTKPEKFVPRREFTPPDEVPLWENDKKGFTQQKIHWSLDGPEYHSWAHGWNAYEKFRAYCRSSFCPPIIGIMLNTLELDDVEGAQKLIENALPPVAKFDLDRVFQESEELRLRKVSDFNRNWHRKIRIIRAKEAEDKEKKEKGDDYNDVPDATTAMIDLTKEVSEEESHIPEESSSSSNSIKQRSQFLQGGTTDTPSAEELKTSPTQETEAASFQPLNAPRKERQHESDSETERTPVKRQRRRMWGNGA